MRCSRWKNSHGECEQDQIHAGVYSPNRNRPARRKNSERACSHQTSAKEVTWKTFRTGKPAILPVRNFLTARCWWAAALARLAGIVREFVRVARSLWAELSKIMLLRFRIHFHLSRARIVVLLLARHRSLLEVGFISQFLDAKT